MSMPTNRNSLFSTSTVSVDQVMSLVISRVAKLSELTSKASSFKQENADNKAAEASLNKCLSTLLATLKSPKEQIKNATSNESVDESHESTNYNGPR